MREGNFVKLELKNVLNASQHVPGSIQECQIIEYDEEKDRLILLLREGELKDLLLSAKYGCSVYADEGTLYCTGEVIRRYRGEKGNIVEFYIEKGFYKINNK